MFADMNGTYYEEAEIVETFDENFEPESLKQCIPFGCVKAYMNSVFVIALEYFQAIIESTDQTTAVESDDVTVEMDDVTVETLPQTVGI